MLNSQKPPIIINALRSAGICITPTHPMLAACMYVLMQILQVLIAACFWFKMHLKKTKYQGSLIENKCYGHLFSTCNPYHITLNTWIYAQARYKVKTAGKYQSESRIMTNKVDDRTSSDVDHHTVTENSKPRYNPPLLNMEKLQPINMPVGVGAESVQVLA